MVFGERYVGRGDSTESIASPRCPRFLGRARRQTEPLVKKRGARGDSTESIASSRCPRFLGQPDGKPSRSSKRSEGLGGMIFLRVSLPSDALSGHAMRSRPDRFPKTSQVYFFLRVSLPSELSLLLKASNPLSFEILPHSPEKEVFLRKLRHSSFFIWLVSYNTVSYTQPHLFSQNSCGMSGFYHSNYRRYIF